MTTTTEVRGNRRGLLLLDVDGPLNPYAAKPWRRPEGYQSYRYTRDGRWLTGRDFRREKGYRVWLNPTHGADILAVAQETCLQPVWATAWMDDANRYIGPAVGLPGLPVIHFPDADIQAAGVWASDGNWKWHSIADWADGIPLAWWDDECQENAHASGREEFLHRRGNTPTLLCHVDPRTGLMQQHLDDVRRWAAALPTQP